MYSLSLNAGQIKTVLCLGAHCDDIEIGCGGTILRLVKENPAIELHWVVFSSDPIREREASRSASQFLDGASSKNLVIKKFRNGYFPFIASDIKDYFEEMKATIEPDVVFSHYRDDLHQDHRLLAELTWNTFRDHLILEYEIVKYDGGLGSPNFFVPLDDAICEKKVSLLMDCYGSQKPKRWFTEDTFLALLRLRGVESNARYAEAFYCRKVVV